jgi:hypothetical protein
MPNSIHFSEDWSAWEVDPSTRTSVHAWTKYAPIDITIGTTAVDIFTVARGMPSVNLVKNPSFEVNTLTDFTVSGSAIAQSNAQAAIGAYSLLVNPDNSAAGEGYYWAHNFAGAGEDSSHICASVEVRGASASGTVKITVENASGTILATGTTVTLSTGWQRLTVSCEIPERVAAEYRVAVRTAAQHNITWYNDKWHVEQRKDGIVQPYVDGTLGVNYEWYGTANLSASRLRTGIVAVRGFRLKNGHGSQTVNIALDNTATAAGATSTGVLLKAGETWEPPWPIDIRTRISAIASGASTQIYGVVWGIHEG